MLHVMPMGRFDPAPGSGAGSNKDAQNTQGGVLHGRGSLASQLSLQEGRRKTTGDEELEPLRERTRDLA